MRYLSQEQNARAEGRDGAVEWSSRAGTIEEWRVRCRAEITHKFESGRNCILCSAGTSREEFAQLLAEWDRGFAEAAKMLFGSREDRSVAIKDVAARANAMCSLLGTMNILPEEAKLHNLQACAHLADEITDDLFLLAGGVA